MYWPNIFVVISLIVVMPVVLRVSLRYLAVGTRDGVVAIWRYQGPLRDVQAADKSFIPSNPSSAADWEVVSIDLVNAYSNR